MKKLAIGLFAVSLLFANHVIAGEGKKKDGENRKEHMSQTHEGHGNGDHDGMHDQDNHGGKPTTVAQKTCPVMGGEINKEIYADHDGKRVYFCCESCIDEFKKDPQKYLSKLEERGEKPEVIEAAVPQKTCPVMGGEINKEIYADHEGKRVYFCCPGCISAFEKDPVKYLEKLESLGETPETI